MFVGFGFYWDQATSSELGVILQETAKERKEGKKERNSK